MSQDFSISRLCRLLLCGRRGCGCGGRGCGCGGGGGGGGGGDGDGFDLRELLFEWINQWFSMVI